VYKKEKILKIKS